MTVLPMFAEKQPGVHDNALIVVDATGTIHEKCHKQHLATVEKIREKFPSRPGNLEHEQLCDPHPPPRPDVNGPRAYRAKAAAAASRTGSHPVPVAAAAPRPTRDEAAPHLSAFVTRRRRAGGRTD